MAVEKRKRGEPRKESGADRAIRDFLKPLPPRRRKSALANPPAGMQKRRGRPRKNPLDNPRVKAYVAEAPESFAKWVAQDGSGTECFIGSDGTVSVRRAANSDLQAEVADLRLKAEKKSLERFLAEGDAIGVLCGSGDPTMKSGGPGKLTHSRAIEELEGQLAAWTKTLMERFEAAENRIASLENKVG